MTTRINQNPGTQYITNRGVSDSKSPGTQKAADSGQPGSDRVSLSAKADRLSQLTQIAASSPDVDSAKVEALRHAIANGEYAVNADELASSMLTADRLIGR